MSNLTDVQAVIDAHESHADQAYNDLQSIVSTMAGIGSVIPGSIDIPNDVDDPAGTVAYLSPDMDLYNAFGADYTAVFAELQAWLTGLRDGFLTLFFPQITGLIATESDDWLVEVIRDGSTGIPPGVQNAIFERGRERVLKEGARAKDEAMSAWAAKGYTLPSALLVDSISRVDQDTMSKVSELNRDMTIKVLDVQLDMVKFAIGETTRLRLGVVAATNDYLRSFALAPSAAADVAAKRSNAKASLWDAARGYYAALVDFKRLEGTINVAKSNTSEAQAKVDVAALQANLQRQLTATEAAATTYGNLVAAAMSGLNSIVTNAYQANKQE